MLSQIVTNTTSETTFSATTKYTPQNIVQTSRSHTQSYGCDRFTKYASCQLLSFVPLITLCTSKCCDNSNIVHGTNSHPADLDDHCVHYCAQWQSAFAQSHLFQSSQGDLDFQHHAQLHTILVIVQRNSIYIVEQQPTLYLKKSGCSLATPISRNSVCTTGKVGLSHLVLRCTCKQYSRIHTMSQKVQPNMVHDMVHDTGHSAAWNAECMIGIG